jgi:endoglucanase
MARAVARVTVGVVLAALILTAGSAEASPVIAVRGNNLVDGHGRIVRLLGVNRSGAEYACAQGWGFWDGPVDDASIRAMTSWGINAVRLPLNEACWLGLHPGQRRAASPSCKPS